ncbi:hypothetical protein CY34DRAFT_17272 [Suillus luteus UH-Slu-Lm8-n1]|uniref:Uncharacterized protein n=1 Tax=Suillus luteus UH-Slu-Lm8-n1 TaxID=930992 RepID=A0A0D0ASZ7_9AGAM|nr:hypothetical protein CY34DRAFT_17272 [Suillus luteus UH-Slu-Lm8-n1]
MALIARRYITSDRYNPSKKRSSKQKAHLISLNSKTHTEKENNPNFGNTTPRPVTRTQNELAVQQEKAITYERRYRNADALVAVVKRRDHSSSQEDTGASR